MFPFKLIFFLATIFVSDSLSAQMWLQQGVDIGGEATEDVSGGSVSLSSDGTVVAIGATHNDGIGYNSGHVRIYALDGSSWSQLGGDIDGEAADDWSGYSVSLSSDGTVVAIGAIYNGGNGNLSGHTRIYAWDGSSWSQLGVDIDGEAVGDLSSSSVSLSSDGTVVAIGALFNDENGESSGHTRIYAWDGTSWIQRGVDIDGEAVNDYSGSRVSLSSDGTVVAIGAPNNDENGSDSGHVRIYAWDGSSWSQLGGDIDGEAASDLSGGSVSLSSDGTAVAIGARYNDGNGNDSGHTRIYVWDGSSWSQLGGDIDGEAMGDFSGCSVSLSSDGTVVAIGATYNDGIAINSGHVRIYALDGSSWSQLGGDIDGEAVGDFSGWSVSLSSDGTVVAIGAPYNDGIGINSGHVRIFALCDAPESPATAAVFGTGSTTSLNLASFTAPASGADGYAIYMSDANSFTPPSDGDEPVADASWNGTGQQAIYFGTSSSPNLTVTDLSPGTQYYFQIYAYTDCSGTEVYEGTGLNTTDTTDPGELTITGLTGDDKEYDGTTDATASGTATLSGIVGAHDVSLSGTPTFTFASADAGTGIAIATTGYTLSGADASKYTLTQPTLSANITMCPSPTGSATAVVFGTGSTTSLNLASFTAPSSGADGYAIYMSDANSFTSPSDGDEPVADASWNGTGQQAIYFGTSSSPDITVTDLGMGTPYYFQIYAYTDCSGTEVYEGTGLNATATTEQGELTITGLTGDDKEYDSTTDATASGTATLSGIVGAHDVSLSGTPTFTFASADAGTGIAIATTGYTLSGADASKYTLTQPTLSANITMCPSPTGPATAAEFGVRSSNSLHLSGFTAPAGGADGYVIYMNSTDSFTPPNDGEEPAADAIWNDTGQQAVYFYTSSESDLTITGLSPNTSYYFQVYAFMDCAGFEVYETTGLSTGAIETTPIDLPMWLQQADDIDGEDSDDRSGRSVSLSSDGSVVAIGAFGNGDNGSWSGHVRIFERDGSGNWTQRGEDIDGEALGDQSGSSVALSADGSVVAVGAEKNDDNGSNSGHVRIYEWDGTSWTQRGVDIDGEAADDYAGRLSLSADGSLVAIGAPYNDNNGNNSGHVRVFEWDGSDYILRGAAIQGEVPSERLGDCVSLSADGSILAIGAAGDDGHVRIYAWDGASESWNPRGSVIDGWSWGVETSEVVSLSSDGNVVAIGSPWSRAHSGSFSDTDWIWYSGQVHVYAWDGSDWIQRGGAIEGEYGAHIGTDVSLSSDGNILAVGADESDAHPDEGGYARIYTWDGVSWTQSGGDIVGEEEHDEAGSSVSLSSDGKIVAIGAINNDAAGWNAGHVRIFALCDAPESPATAAVFGTGSTTSLNLASFTAPASGADGYAIYMSDANTFTPPSDGDEPVADASWNGTGQQAIYFGTSSSPDVTVTDLAPGTPYYFQIYAYNDCSGTEVYEGTGLNATATTEQGELTITGLTGDDKEYDGTTDATASGTAALSGIVGAHDVSLSGTPTFTFASADAGTGIAIATTGYTLSGADASKYTLTQPSLSASIGANGEPLTVFDFISLDTNTVNTFSMTTHFDRALDSLSNHPLSPAVIDRNGFLGGHVMDEKVFLEYSIHQVVDSINALNGHE